MTSNRKTTEQKRNEFRAELIASGIPENFADIAVAKRYPAKAEKGAIVARDIGAENGFAVQAVESVQATGVQINKLAVVKRGHTLIVDNLLRTGAEGAQAVVLGYAMERKAVTAIKNLIADSLLSGRPINVEHLVQEFRQFDGLRRFAQDAKRMVERFASLDTAVAMHMVKRPELNFRTTAAQFKNRAEKSAEIVKAQQLNAIH